MPKVFYCSKCALQHPRPVGKKCQYKGESSSSDVEVAAPPSTEMVGNATVSQQILLQLQQLGDKMDQMDRRVQRTESALEQGTSQVSSLTVTSHNSPNPKVLSNSIDTETAVESVVPSLGYLRNNESVQDWSQNFILTGSRKTRPSYDDLTMAQWVSGFVRCVQEEKSEAARASMLDYLGNLMEDASDFSWE